MDDRLKERLTGAVVLVALIVAFVPAIFSGAPPREAPGDALVTSLNPPAAQPLPVPLPVPAGSGGETAPTLEQLPAPAPEPAAPEPAVPEPAAPVIQAPQPAMAASTRTPSAAPAGAAPASGWVVQLGSFREPANAQRMARSARGKGFDVAVAGPDDRGFYRVRTAIVAERSAAQALRERLKQAGLDGMLSSAP